MKALGIITLGGILFVRDDKNSNGYIDKWMAQEGSRTLKTIEYDTGRKATPFTGSLCEIAVFRNLGSL